MVRQISDHKCGEGQRAYHTMAGTRPVPVSCVGNPALLVFQSRWHGCHSSLPQNGAIHFEEKTSSHPTVVKSVSARPTHTHTCACRTHMKTPAWNTLTLSFCHEWIVAAHRTKAYARQRGHNNRYSSPGSHHEVLPPLPTDTLCHLRSAQGVENPPATIAPVPVHHPTLTHDRLHGLYTQYSLQTDHHCNKYRCMPA